MTKLLSETGRVREKDMGCRLWTRETFVDARAF